jgi:hypothetical protein
MKKQIGHVDLGTGEVLQGVPFWVGVKSSPYGNRWFMANQDALVAIAKDKELTTEPYRVLAVPKRLKSHQAARAQGYPLARTQAGKKLRLPAQSLLRVEREGTPAQ